MTAWIKNLNTDFTRFLGEKTRHTVKIVTNTETLECSGAVISQHSEVMKKMVENDEEIFLNNYEFAKECLTILHGGSVELTEENCEEIIKFGIQFDITDIVEQGLVFLEAKVNENNLTGMVKVCWRAKNFANFCNCNANIDYFWPLEDSMKALDLAEAETLVTDINLKSGIKVVLGMLTNKDVARKLLKIVTSLIDQSNITEILEAFQQYEYHKTYVEAFSGCPKRDSLTFFQKIEVWGLLIGQWRSFQTLTKGILRELATRVSLDLSFIPDEQYLLTCWRQFSEEDILQVCKVCATSFYICEMVMSWVALNKPDLRTVRHFCSLLELDTTQLDRQYLTHVKRVLKAEGYVVSFDFNNCTANHTTSFNHTANHTTSFNHTTIITKILQTKDHIDNNNVAGRVISFKRISGNHSFADQEDINVEVNPNASFNRRIFCEKGAVNRLYGRGVSGKQVPFYTDVQAAVRTDVVYDANTLRVLLERD